MKTPDESEGAATRPSETISTSIIEEFSLADAAERLLLELTTRDGPQLAGGSGSVFNANPIIKQAWRYMRNEVHVLVCTKSRKYAKEREAFNTLTKPMILLFGGLLTNKYGMDGAVASSMAALALSVSAPQILTFRKHDKFIPKHFTVLGKNKCLLRVKGDSEIQHVRRGYIVILQYYVGWFKIAVAYIL